MTVKFIDLHAHVYRKPVPFVVQFCTPDELLRRYDEAGIEMGCLLPIVNSEIYFPQANEDILEIAEQHPDRFIPFCNVDPRALTNSADADLGRVLRYYKDRGCRGIGEVMPNLPLLDARVQNLCHHASESGLPIVFDGSSRLGGDFGLQDDPGLPQLESTLLKYPDLIVFGHGRLFWLELTVDFTPGERKPVFRSDGEYIFPPYRTGSIKKEGVVPDLFRKYPNLLGELSDAAPFLERDHEFAAKFLTEFQDRLFFGTDICFADMPFGMLTLLNQLYTEQKISKMVFLKIARENAIRFLNL